jgi:hypothetical protein
MSSRTRTTFMPQTCEASSPTRPVSPGTTLPTTTARRATRAVADQVSCNASRQVCGSATATRCVSCTPSESHTVMPMRVLPMSTASRASAV